VVGDGNHLLRSCLALLILVCVTGLANAQDAGEQQEVNQLLATGTRVNYAHGKWAYSGILQVRLDEGYQALNVWYVEGVVRNLRLKHVEFAPDLRFSVYPDRFEVRPGFGVILKATGKKRQIALQHKYQVDIPSDGVTGQGVRQILFLNAVVKEKFIPGLVGGWFYRWRGEFNDFEFWRAGGGVTYLFDPIHALNVSYFWGWENNGIEWTRSGFLLVQLSLNIRTDWKYVPAKIFDF
jgi:hypothetical protein